MLVKVSQTRPELVASIGLCNFDSKHVEIACEHLITKFGSVGTVVSNQVQVRPGHAGVTTDPRPLTCANLQFSVVDPRPLRSMCEVCAKYGLQLLTYGTLVGHLESGLERDI